MEPLATGLILLPTSLSFGLKKGGGLVNDNDDYDRRAAVLTAMNNE